MLIKNINYIACLSCLCVVVWQYDDSRSQELLERKIKNAPEGQGSVRMLTREEWDEFREVRPRTPFESTLARPNSRIRTGEPLRLVIAFTIKPAIKLYRIGIISTKESYYLPRLEPEQLLFHRKTSMN